MDVEENVKLDMETNVEEVLSKLIQLWNINSAIQIVWKLGIQEFYCKCYRSSYACAFQWKSVYISLNKWSY